MAEWFSQPLVLFIAILAASLLLAKAVLYVLTHYVRKWAARTKTTLDDRLLEAVSLPVYAALLLGGSYVAYRVSFGDADWLDAGGKVGLVVVGAFFPVRCWKSSLRPWPCITATCRDAARPLCSPYWAGWRLRCARCA